MLKEVGDDKQRFSNIIKDNFVQIATREIRSQLIANKQSEIQSQNQLGRQFQQQQAASRQQQQVQAPVQQKTVSRSSKER